MDIKLNLIPVIIRTLCEDHLGNNKTKLCKSRKVCYYNGGCPLFVDEDNKNQIKTLEELKKFVKEQDLNIKLTL